MRVLHVLPSIARAYGGPTQSLLGYALASQHAGIDLDVIAPHPGTADLDWWHEALPSQNPLTFASLGGGALITSPGLLSWLWRHGARYDVIHIHALQNPVSSLAARIAAHKGWRFIIRPLGMLSAFTFTHRRQRMKRLYFAAIDRPNLAHASGLHFTTVGEREEALLRVAALQIPTFVIPPPFSGQAAAPKRAGRPRVLFLSRLHPVKNLEALLSCWPEVVKRVPHAELLLAGDGDQAYVRELKALAQRLGIAGSTSFVGFVNGSQKRDLLASAHAFALISFHENFGVAALEAMAAVLPTVLSRGVHLGPFVSQHGLGVVVDGSDAAMLANAVVRCLTDADLQAHCRSTAGSVVAQFFSAEAIGLELTSMYQSVIGAPHRSSPPQSSPP